MSVNSQVFDIYFHYYCAINNFHSWKYFVLRYNVNQSADRVWIKLCLQPLSVVKCAQRSQEMRSCGWKWDKGRGWKVLSGCRAGWRGWRGDKYLTLQGGRHSVFVPIHQLGAALNMLYMGVRICLSREVHICPGKCEKLFDETNIVRKYERKWGVGMMTNIILIQYQVKKIFLSIQQNYEPQKTQWQNICGIDTSPLHAYTLFIY